MLYNLAIIIYDIAVHLAAPFSRKPRKMMKGHWVVYELLRQQLEKDARYIWFHAASLGEFEQGRPLIDTAIDASEVILALAPETNGHVAVKAWQALGEITGRERYPSGAAQRGREDSLSRYSGAAA